MMISREGRARHTRKTKAHSTHICAYNGRQEESGEDDAKPCDGTHGGPPPEAPCKQYGQRRQADTDVQATGVHAIRHAEL